MRGYVLAGVTAFLVVGILAAGCASGDSRPAAGPSVGSPPGWTLRHTLVSPENPATYDPDPVDSVAFSPRGTTLAVSGLIGTHLWDVATGMETATFPNPDTSSANGVAFSPDGTTLAIGDGNGTTYLWVNTPHK
jgi:WD40 repeat protein